MKKLGIILTLSILLFCVGMKFNSVAMVSSQLSPQEIANLNRELARLGDQIPRLERRLERAGMIEEFDIAQELTAKQRRKQEIEYMLHFNQIIGGVAHVREAIAGARCPLKEKFVKYLLDIKIPQDGRMSWCPDSSKLAIGSEDSAKMWDAITGTQIGPNLMHVSIRSVLWSPDGTKLATGGHGGAKIWNVATGTQIGPNLNHGNRTKLIAWTPDGTLLITQADNNSVKLWNIATGTQIGADLYNDPDDLINVTLSPDGSKLAGIIGSNNEAEIIDLTTRHRIRYAFYTDRLFSLVWSPDGTQLATVGSDNGRSYPVKIFDAASGTQIGRNLAEVSKGNAWMFGFGKLIAWSPNGAQLATVFDSDQSTNQRYGITITFWNVATRSKINPNIKMQDEYFRAMAWNPNGTKLAVSHWRGLKIFNVTTRKEVSPSIKGEAASVVRALAWSPDSSKLAITSGPGFGWSIIRSFSIVDFLKNLNINQCHLLQAFEQMFYREQFGKPPMPIQATALQWETFVSLPESIQRKLRRFITQQLNHI